MSDIIKRLEKTNAPANSASDNSNDNTSSPVITAAERDYAQYRAINPVSSSPDPYDIY